MHLKNDSLKELYDAIVNGTITFSVYEESPIDKAFGECDDKLSESATFERIKDLRNRNDILKKSYANVLSMNVDLAIENEDLKKDLGDTKNQLKQFTQSRNDWRSRAKHAENEVEELKATLTELRNNCNAYHDLYNELSKAYDNLSEENRKLKSRPNSIYGKGSDYESCFNAMIDGFETVDCAYLEVTKVIEIQFDPNSFEEED